MRICIQIVGSPATPVFELAGPVVTIGRHAHCDVPVEGKVSVSGEHARITLSAQGAMLADLQSRNGTYLNDRRIEGQKALRRGDYVRLGQTGPTFQVVELDLREAPPVWPPRGTVQEPVPAGAPELPQVAQAPLPAPMPMPAATQRLPTADASAWGIDAPARAPGRPALTESPLVRVGLVVGAAMLAALLTIIVVLVVMLAARGGDKEEKKTEREEYPAIAVRNVVPALQPSGSGEPHRALTVAVLASQFCSMNVLRRNPVDRNAHGRTIPES